jgi:hypothetical protein
MRLYLSGGRLLVVARFQMSPGSWPESLATILRVVEHTGKIGTDGREQVKNVKVIPRFMSNVGEDPGLSSKTAAEINAPLPAKPFPLRASPTGTSNCSPIARQAYPLRASPPGRTLIACPPSLIP